MIKTLRIAIIQSMDGHITICGPNDYEDGGHLNAWDAAVSWHLEAGHFPAATYWAEIEVPSPPAVPELRAKAEAGEFPKRFIEERTETMTDDLLADLSAIDEAAMYDAPAATHSTIARALARIIDLTRQLADARSALERVRAALAFVEPLNRDALNRSILADLAQDMSLRKCAEKHGTTLSIVRRAALKEQPDAK